MSTWKIIVIPLSVAYKDDKEISIAKEIFDNLGYKSLDDVKSLDCNTIVELFYLILLHEHYIAKELYKKYVNPIDYSKYMSSKDAVSENMLHDISQCTEIDDDALRTLILDLYPFRDDHYAFNPYKNMQYTAIVLLDNNGIYAGHIYAWPSNVFSNCMSAQGIRTSLYNPSRKTIKQVSEKLMNGLTQFALENGCNYLQIISPTPNMLKILLRLGFVKLMIPREDELKIPSSHVDIEPQYDLFKKIIPSVSVEHKHGHGSFNNTCKPVYRTGDSRAEYYTSIPLSIRKTYDNLLHNTIH